MSRTVKAQSHLSLSRVQNMDIRVNKMYKSTQDGYGACAGPQCVITVCNSSVL